MTQGSVALAEPLVAGQFVADSSTTLKVKLHSGGNALAELRAEWDELLEQSAQRVFFLRWDWNRLWWETYAPPGSRLYLLACRTAEGKLVGLAPLYWQERSFAGVPHIRDLNFLGTGAAIKTSEHLDLIARRGYESAVAEAVALFLSSRSDWDRLWLWNIPGHSQMLPRLSEALGGQARVSICDHPHSIDAESDWETIKSQWARKFRYNIERCARNLYKQHAAEFRRVETAIELEAALDDFIRLHQLRWTAKGHSGSFTYPKFEAFLRTAMREALSAGRLAFWTFKLDGQCVAALVAFTDNGVAHYFQSGFDVSYAKHSLGSVMLAQCIQACAAAPEIREFDFMGGGAAYKDSWTNEARDAYELELFRPGLRALLYLTGQKTRRLLSHLRRALRAHAQQQQAEPG
jgi:CelD/BcsL family acetyltransferase involved in cellulose biosynthesis